MTKELIAPREGSGGYAPDEYSEYAPDGGTVLTQPKI